MLCKTFKPSLLELQPFNFCSLIVLSTICLFYTFSNTPWPFITLLTSDGKALTLLNGILAKTLELTTVISSANYVDYRVKFVIF